MDKFNTGKHILDFTAKWCGPCQRIKPTFNELKEKYTEINFVVYDVDECPDVAKEFKIEAMPTFIAIKDGEIVQRFSGASVDKLKDMVNHL